MKLKRALPAEAAVAGLGVLTSLVLALRFGWNRLLSGSVDITYHLQVLDAVRGGGPVPASAKAFMAEMYGYPDIGHRLAAALTWFGIGDLNALVLTGLFFGALAWFCLLDQARRAGMLVLAVGALLSVGNGYLTRASFGAEIVGNFFFSQAVGEGFALAALTLGQPILRRSPRGYAAYAVLATLIAGGMHTIPALHVAGAAAALLALDAGRRLIRERRFDWALPIALVAIPAAIVANPYFASMRRNSSNDGAVGYAMEIGLGLLGGAELLLLALSAFVLVRRLLDGREAGPAERASAWLAAVGAAVAAAGLLQFLVWFGLHQSSPYAIKKEAFGVFSLLAFLLPLALTELPRLHWPAPPWGPAIVVAGQFAVVGVMFSAPPGVDVQRMDRLLADLREVRAARGLDQSDILFVSDKARPLVSYAVSAAALRRKRDEAAFEVLETGIPLRTEDVAWVATPIGDLYDKPACRDGRPPVHGIVVVRAACAAPPVADFRAGGDGAAYLKSGWSLPERGGVWSVGKRAVVELPIPAEAKAYRAPWLQIGAFGFLPESSPNRTVRVSVAGDAAEVFTFRPENAHVHIFALPIPPAAMVGDTLEVVFEIENPITPREAGTGEDDRPLGIGLERMRLLPTVQPAF
jgi:hypothetical protein